MSRSASAPSASRPSGISDRRVVSRVTMSVFADLDVARPDSRSVRLTAFSLAIDPGQRLAAARRHVHLPEARIDLAVGIEDVRQQLGACMRAHAVERRPDLGSAPMSPSLWQAAHAPVKSVAAACAASPGFSTSGSSAAMTSLRARAAEADRVQIGGGLARHLFVRVVAQARHVGRTEIGGGDGASSERRDERERRLGPPQQLVDDQRRVRSGQRRRSSTASASAPAASPTVTISRSGACAASAGSVSIGAMAASASARTRGHGEQAGRDLDAPVVARGRHAELADERAAARVGVRARARRPCPTSRPTGSAAAVVAGSASSVWSALVRGGGQRRVRPRRRPAQSRGRRSS